MDRPTIYFDRSGPSGNIYALSPCDMSDVIFSFFIENELYSVVDLCIELDKRGLPSLFNE